MKTIEDTTELRLSDCIPIIGIGKYANRNCDALNPKTEGKERDKVLLGGFVLGAMNLAYGFLSIGVIAEGINYFLK